MAFKNPLEPLLVRRGAPDLVFYDTKRGCDFREGRRGEWRRSAAKRSETRPSGCFLALKEPPDTAKYDTKRCPRTKCLVNYDMKCLQEAPKPKKQISMKFNIILIDFGFSKVGHFRYHIFTQKLVNRSRLP